MYMIYTPLERVHEKWNYCGLKFQIHTVESIFWKSFQKNLNKLEEISKFCSVANMLFLLDLKGTYPVNWPNHFTEGKQVEVSYDFKTLYLNCIYTPENTFVKEFRRYVVINNRWPKFI